MGTGKTAFSILIHKIDSNLNIRNKKYFLFKSMKNINSVVLLCKRVE